MNDLDGINAYIAMMLRGLWNWDVTPDKPECVECENTDCETLELQEEAEFRFCCVDDGDNQTEKKSCTECAGRW